MPRAYASFESEEDAKYRNGRSCDAAYWAAWSLILSGNALNEITKMFVEHAVYVHVLVHAVSITQGTYRSAKKDAVEPRQDTDNTIAMSFDKTLHGSLLRNVKHDIVERKEDGASWSLQYLPFEHPRHPLDNPGRSPLCELPRPCSVSERLPSIRPVVALAGWQNPQHLGDFFLNFDDRLRLAEAFC